MEYRGGFMDYDYVIIGAGKATMGLEYLFRRTGPLTMPPSQLG